MAVEPTPEPPKRRKRDRDREERVRLAGGPQPSLREKAYAFASKRTTVRTCDFTAIGIPRHYLTWMCEEGLLVKVGYGVYRAADREAA
ncbi:type IV toxin-antitoxin system AbiEi family antitoxin domain-containing protein [Rhizobium sp. CIAT894]|uniref:type IV toxin-antitoxin system AbiEi family antitoxin domain-containing protein n=1 Tax=Rhizobium sp. CIAT894 TaxID=2020312 RepID=UPI000A1FF280|nr:type IV toxin-antitoxin system AbiEi family antitoxin domain-containing protein [Rhizobium sp. CIAT894]